MEGTAGRDCGVVAASATYGRLGRGNRGRLLGFSAIKGLYQAIPLAATGW